ncbi:F-box protein [Aspergillus lucknowensis]|uniref:F-box domain-containing protein n=1 Tax=Aspergillus lucknowensis TaxID=176173 RepID=A0ABR4LX63_9EURO
MDRLPVELVRAIAAEVVTLTDRLSLRRVCRRWRAIVDDVVFTSFEISGRQIRRLVEAILARPRIGASIRALSVQKWAVLRSGALRSGPLSPETKALAKGSCSSTEIGRRWCHELEQGNQEAWFALLLVLVPNLTNLSSNYSWPTDWTTMVVSRAAFKELPTLQALNSLDLTIPMHVKYVSGLHTIPIYQVLPFLHLPSIQTVRVERVADSKSFELSYVYGAGDHPALHPCLRTSPLESLIVNPSHSLEGEGAADLIDSCANLKHFIFQNQNVIDRSLCRIFRPLAFRAPLLGQKHSLEVLHFNNEGDGSSGLGGIVEEDDPAPSDRWFGSFAEFKRLRDLRVRVHNLLNLHPLDRHELVALKDTLPSSLKSLHITDCDEVHCPVLVSNFLDLLAHPSRIPNLEEVFVYSAIAGGPVWGVLREQFAPVQEMFGRAEIKFELSLGRGS